MALVELSVYCSVHQLPHFFVARLGSKFFFEFPCGDSWVRYVTILHFVSSYI
jgi:hypothetical protein